MRSPRLVTVSAVLLSVVIASDAQARPRLPGIFGAVFGMIGLHHHAYARHHAPHVANVPEHPAADSVPPAPANIANGGPMGPGVPPFWPQLGDDMFDYVLWPSGKDDHLWAYGYDDIVDGALRPANRGAPQRGAGQAVASGGGGAPVECAAQQGSASAASVTDRIEQTLRPTDAQRAKLDALRGALQHAFEYLDHACPADRPQTPTARLDAMEDRAWAGRQALLVVRAPLEALYASLSDEQKARLNGPLVQGASRAAGCRQSTIDLPGALMGGRGRVAPTQRPAIEALQKTSMGLSRLLATSCPATMPATPVERLDAADKRLNSMLYAVVTLRAPLDALASSQPNAPKPQAAGPPR
jgi:hypothetical protein